MTEKEVEIGVKFATDISFFDNADEKTKMQIRSGAEVIDNKVLCEITDIHQSLYDTSYFEILVPWKFGGGSRIVVPFGNDISGFELVRSQKDAIEICRRAKDYMEAMVVSNKKD